MILIGCVYDDCFVGLVLDWIVWWFCLVACGVVLLDLVVDICWFISMLF